ncbi:MAG TPA: hypothetical protein ENI87_04195 [bacterium]|nr:hypothetical protein [bacterium]
MPSAPTPASGRVPGPATGRRRGAPLVADLTTWRQWWAFNHDAYLLPRATSASVRTGASDFYLGATRRPPRVTSGANAPTRAVVVGDVLPALRAAVTAGPRDVIASGLLALGRIALDHPGFRTFDVIAARLRDEDQRVRETAALALGLAGRTDPRCLATLRDVLHDAANGDRTRSFAAYGLGLLAHRSAAVQDQRDVFEVLDHVLREQQGAARELRVAVVQAMGLLSIDDHTYEGARLLREAVTALERTMTSGGRRGEVEVLAHCPTALARLLSREHYLAHRCKRRMAALLGGRSPETGLRQRVPHALAQSCALALGRLVRADAACDVGVRRALVDAAREHKDAQTRYFAVIALAQIGGDDTRELLLRWFRRSNHSVARAWYALALGVLGDGHYARTGVPDVLVVEALERSFRSSKNPETVGAIAVALGLSHADRAAQRLAQRLLDHRAKEAMAAALCDALSLVGGGSAREALAVVVAECDRRPLLFEHAGKALARLGDPEVGERMLRRFALGEPNYAMQIALTEVLAAAGDRRHVAKLVEVLADPSRSAVTRASAARALGDIADGTDGRWNTPLRRNVNYRANVATLTDRQAGVLDLR